MSGNNKKSASRTDKIDAGRTGVEGVNPPCPTQAEVSSSSETGAVQAGLQTPSAESESIPTTPQLDAPVSDAELLQRWSTGDEWALETLLSRYEKPVYLFVLGLLRDPHRAEDVLQETFYTALSRLDGVDRHHFRGWLFTVAYHQAMLERRRQALQKRFGSAERRVEELPLPASTPEPWQQLQSQELTDQVERWLTQLPQRQREVVWMRLFEGLRFREIAARLGFPLGTALACWHQALKRILRLAENSPTGDTNPGSEPLR